MAFINEIMSDYGIPCTYHKITRYTQQSTTIEIVLSSYVNKEAREQNKMPLQSRTINIPMYNNLNVLNEVGMNHLKYAYQKLTELSIPDNSPQSVMPLGIYGLGELISDEVNESETTN